MRRGVVPAGLLVAVAGLAGCSGASASDACSHTYLRSSARRPAGEDGRPAYTARARLLYDVRFEMNGAPLALPGAPDSLQSPWATVGVPVAEVQSVATRTP
jgi:hypothetical protein